MIQGVGGKAPAGIISVVGAVGNDCAFLLIAAIAELEWETDVAAYFNCSC
jgi:hypothetical protein